MELLKTIVGTSILLIIAVAIMAACGMSQEQITQVLFIWMI